MEFRGRTTEDWVTYRRQQEALKEAEKYSKSTLAHSGQGGSHMLRSDIDLFLHIAAFASY